MQRTLARPRVQAIAVTQNPLALQQCRESALKLIIGHRGLCLGRPREADQRPLKRACRVRAIYMISLVSWRSPTIDSLCEATYLSSGQEAIDHDTTDFLHADCRRRRCNFAAVGLCDRPRVKHGGIAMPVEMGRRGK